jgi:hypothetical protein
VVAAAPEPRRYIPEIPKESKVQQRERLTAEIACRLSTPWRGSREQTASMNLSAGSGRPTRAQSARRGSTPSPSQGVESGTSDQRASRSPRCIPVFAERRIRQPFFGVRRRPLSPMVRYPVSHGRARLFRQDSHHRVAGAR